MVQWYSCVWHAIENESLLKITKESPMLPAGEPEKAIIQTLIAWSSAFYQILDVIEYTNGLDKVNLNR